MVSVITILQVTADFSETQAQLVFFYIKCKLIAVGFSLALVPNKLARQKNGLMSFVGIL